MLPTDIALTALILLSCILLWLAAGAAEKIITTKWRLCYLIPAVLCCIAITVAGPEKYMIGVYIGTAILLLGFFNEKKNIRRISCICAVVPTIISFALCQNAIDYRSRDYAEDFRQAFEKLSKHYVLTEHKNVDFDALYNEYYPKFKEATENADEVENYMLWAQFCGELGDPHVVYIPFVNADNITEQANKRIFGNDYGLAIMTLADGTVAAVNVDPSLNELGIKNGTIITSWAGKDPADLGTDTTKYMTWGDKENEQFYKTLFGAGQFGEEIEVKFLTDDGAEKNVTLKSLGSYYENRFKSAFETINGGIETGHMTWVDVNEDTAALRIKTMSYDSKSDSNENYDAMKGSIVEKLEELKANGVENIVIDARGNNGGSGKMVMAIAEIFTPVGEHFYCADGVWDDEQKKYIYSSGKDETGVSYDRETGGWNEFKKNYFTGEGLWDGEVVILVNALSVSAADHMVSILNRFDNITVMGFTKSTGAAQGITGTTMVNGMLAFSGSLMLDENGDVFIDADESGICKNDVEIKVPFTTETVTALFDNNEDYLLNKAIEYMKQ